MKFHPGFSKNYITRWVQVTKNVIRFYKNYYHSVSNFRRPLAVIPICIIKKVRSVKIQPPKNQDRKIFGRNPYDSNQFEIVLKEDYEALYDLNMKKRKVEDKRYELELYQKIAYQNKIRQRYRRYRKRCKLSKSPVPDLKFFMQKRGSLHRKSRSQPKLSLRSKLKRHLAKKLGSGIKRSLNMQRPDVSVISRGRSKNLEVSGDRSTISIDDQYIHQSCSKSKSKRKIFQNSFVSIKPSMKGICTSSFDATMVVDGHLMPIRVNKNEPEFHSDIKANKPKLNPNWSKRESDWFKYEL